MKYNKQCLILLVMCLATARCMLRRPPPRRAEYKPREDIRLPPDFRLRDSPAIRIPSIHFCKEQELHPAQHYVVLPWWYHYCQELQERRAKAYKGSIQNLHIYSDVLRRVNNAKMLAKKAEVQM